MLAQAARSKNEGIINLKGNLLDLGNFDRIYHNSTEDKLEPTDKEIGINCTIPAEENVDVRFELELGRWGNEDLLEIRQGLLECKEKEGDKDSSYIKYGRGIDEPLLDVSSIREIEQAKEYYHYTDREIEQVKEYYHYTDLDFNPGKLHVNFPNYLRLPDVRDDFDYFSYSFLPGTINNGLNYKKGIDNFIQLLTDIPPEKLTKKEAENYAEKNCSRSEIIYMYTTVNDVLLHYCTNNLQWINEDGSYDVKLPVLFHQIPDFEKLFLYFKKFHEPLNREYYDIKFSDWYHVLSAQDKDTKANIVKILKSESYAKDLHDMLVNQEFINFGNDPLKSIELPKKLNHARNHLDMYFMYNIKYLGPLRKDPQWGYQAGEKELEKKKDDSYEEHYTKKAVKYDQRMRDVGVKGERTPVVINYLYNNQYKIENYYSHDFFNKPDPAPEDKKKDFSEALTEWLNYIGLADKFKKRDLKR